MTGADPPWYTSFFNEQWREAFHLRIPPEHTAREVDFVVQALGLKPGARMLDLACGHGRHCLELARRGCRVTGIDLSEPALEIARQSATHEGLDVDFVHGDMRVIPFQDEFEAVINMYTSFGFLESEAEDEKVLAGVAGALRPGGRFLIDTSNPLWLFRHIRPRVWIELADGTLLLEHQLYNVVSGRADVTWRLIGRGGRRHELFFSLDRKSVV